MDFLFLYIIVLIDPLDSFHELGSKCELRGSGRVLFDIHGDNLIIIVYGLKTKVPYYYNQTTNNFIDLHVRVLQ